MNENHKKDFTQKIRVVRTDLIIALKAVIRGMINSRQWGNKHTEFNTATRCLKNSPIDKKTVEKFIKKSDWFTWLPKTGEHHISLLTSKKKEIPEFMNSTDEKCDEIIDKIFN